MYPPNRDISIQVLGYWFWWLFIVPSLRSRRPKGPEKKALDIAFLGTPLISILAPVATKDTGLIWLGKFFFLIFENLILLLFWLFHFPPISIANFMVVAGSYGFSFLVADEDDDESNKKQPEWLKFVYKSLDFGSGRERGARK